MLLSDVKNNPVREKWINEAPAPRRKLLWCQSKTESILDLIERSVGYLKEMKILST